MCYSKMCNLGHTQYEYAAVRANPKHTIPVMPGCLLQNGHIETGKDGYLYASHKICLRRFTRLVCEVAAMQASIKAAPLDLAHLPFPPFLPSSLSPFSAACIDCLPAPRLGLSSTTKLLMTSMSLCVRHTCGCLLPVTFNMAVGMCHAASVWCTGGEAAKGHRSVHLLCHGFLLSCRGSCCASAAAEGMSALFCIIV